MPNWWLQWAERIALVLAEWWMRSRSVGTGDGSVNAEPDPDTPDAPVPGENPPR